MANAGLSFLRPRGTFRVMDKRTDSPGRSFRGPLFATALCIASLSACTTPGDTTERPLVQEFPPGWRYPPAAPPLRAQHGMVVSTDSLASMAGLSMLQAGGNAVDAAVATHFALAVVNPEAGNIGGGGFMVLRMADDTRATLDYREKAPLAATADMYLDADGRVTDAGVIGYLASGVPGSVAGMEAAWKRFGSLPWSDLLQPAIRLARDGFVIGPRHLAAVDNRIEDLLVFPSTAAVYLPGGQAPSRGSLFRQPDLARALESISMDGAGAFYRGWIADSVVAEMERGGGIITHQDLAAYEAIWRDPVVLGYRGYEIITMPPPSSGGVTMGQILNIVENFDLADFGWLSADHVHVAVEAMRRAYADRNFYLGDPDYVEIPMGRLLSQAYADSLAGTIDMRLASDSRSFNRVPEESTQTTHFSIVDRDGNAVASTTTLNSWFGSRVVVRGAGFLMNNEMDDEARGTQHLWARPGQGQLHRAGQTDAVGHDTDDRGGSRRPHRSRHGHAGRSDDHHHSLPDRVQPYRFRDPGPEFGGRTAFSPPASAGHGALRALRPAGRSDRRAAEARSRTRRARRDQR